jgi:hypothetical protein
MEFLSLVSHPAFWIVIAAIEEVIALSPLKSNSILQVVFKSLRALRPAGKK